MLKDDNVYEYEGEWYFYDPIAIFTYGPFQTEEAARNIMALETSVVDKTPNIEYD